MTTTFADRLNAHLERNGTVQVTTYMRSTVYRRRHAGMFEDRDGSLYVKRGRHRDKLSIGDLLLVSVRMH